jgi:hypothetical protein
MLREAYHLLATDPLGALAQAHAHARAYRGGVLVQEREIIAIEALLRLGRHERANDARHAFEARHADSAHRRKLQHLFARFGHREPP